jgi:MoxR-like ATPase
LQNQLDLLVAGIGEVILGKPKQIKLALACVLSRGHLLIEDIPGVGKTTLAHALAHLLGLDYQRIQFTSDLLPSDIIGVSIYDRVNDCFHFHPGAVFTQLLLADEINRATPKTQSALLEAMEEQQVTAEGKTRHLPQPFFVVATQNPQSQIGTFPLPESQLDRFQMKISLGYPDSSVERALLAGVGGRNRLGKIDALIDSDALLQLQQQVDEVTVSDAILDYVQRLLAYSRDLGQKGLSGLSPRAGLALLQGAKAWAILAHRDYVLPDDIQDIFFYVADHRMRSDSQVGASSTEVQQILDNVAVI